MKIRTTGWQTSGEDAARARKAPEAELPKLTAERQNAARGFDVTDEQYARVLLAGLYSEERLKTIAERMAATIERAFAKMLPEARAEFFQYEVGLEPHRLMLIHDGKTTWVDIPSDDDSDEALVKICEATAITLKA